MLYIYYVLYKVCIFILVALILIPCYLITYVKDNRARKRRNREMASLVEKLVTVKYNNSDMDSECAICLEYYQMDDELVILPCDERHYFHSN